MKRTPDPIDPMLVAAVVLWIAAALTLGCAT